MTRRALESASAPQEDGDWRTTQLWAPWSHGQWARSSGSPSSCSVLHLLSDGLQGGSSGHSESPKAGVLPGRTGEGLYSDLFNVILASGPEEEADATSVKFTAEVIQEGGASAAR